MLGLVRNNLGIYKGGIQMILADIKKELDEKKVFFEDLGSILRIRESKDGPFILVSIVSSVPNVFTSNPMQFVFVYFPSEVGSKEMYYDNIEKAALIIQRYVEKHYHADRA